MHVEHVVGSMVEKNGLAVDWSVIDFENVSGEKRRQCAELWFVGPLSGWSEALLSARFAHRCSNATVN